MKKKRFTEPQIAFILKQAEVGVSVGEVCRKPGLFRKNSRSLPFDKIDPTPKASQLRASARYILCVLKTLD